MIAAPPAPVQTVASFGSDVCGADTSSCATLGHSCVSRTDSAFFGDPSVRLDALLQQVPDHIVTSMCDSDYGRFVSAIGDRIRAGVLGP